MARTINYEDIAKKVKDMRKTYSELSKESTAINKMPDSKKKKQAEKNWMNRFFDNAQRLPRHIGPMEKDLAQHYEKYYYHKRKDDDQAVLDKIFTKVSNKKKALDQMKHMEQNGNRRRWRDEVSKHKKGYCDKCSKQSRELLDLLKTFL